ncbi:uncharacterized protein PHACADRAFT_249345 [Phanerochaete carnosa HHB-10118-sp]|uniref:Uncharacterized protein n=1 Tax=Phanerochaete carnosa (strain HHB-10118-sp) TaxID=650164 RepID=K5WJ15_PHACS|nr:uncharacterized protein PHACADRAFT_249345 [Phanerochaete carnosa HHB-10118-sp]EKM59114.1 hypothetical protein PHACADRAFT_249345 [Phanerochaete carnosa HHB-10118-sp]
MSLRCYRSPGITSVDEWTAVLHLATEWSFDDIRVLSIERLEPIASPIEKIFLSHSHSIPEWLPAAYVSLCQCPHSLTAAEIRTIQAEDVELIMSVREAMLHARLPSEASEISARVADAMKSATKTAAFIPPNPIPGVTNIVESPIVEPITEGAKVQGLPSEVHLQLNTTSLLSLISTDDVRDIMRQIST